MGLTGFLLILGLVQNGQAFAQESGDAAFTEEGFLDGDDGYDPGDTPSYRRALRDLTNYCVEHPAVVEEVPYAGQLAEGAMPSDAGLAPGHVALTFDDGPSPAVNATIRRTLETCGIRVTFFYVGRKVQWMEEHRPEEAVVRATIAGGHSVGSHSMTHARGLRIGRLATTDTDEARAELDYEVRQSHELVAAAGGGGVSPFIRFPYGNGWRVPEALAYIATLGLTHFFWNMTTGDADAEHPRGGSAVLAHTQGAMLRGSALRGGILLAHEKSSTTSVLPQMLRWMMEHGATFVVFTH